jgi:hypothetical protein
VEIVSSGDRGDVQLGQFAVERQDSLCVGVKVVLLDDPAPPGAQEEDGAILVDAGAVRRVGVVVESRPEGERPRRTADRDRSDFTLDASGGEVLQEAFHARSAFPVAGPAVLALIEVQHEVVAVGGQQAGVVAAIEPPDVSSEFEEQQPGDEGSNGDRNA